MKTCTTCYQTKELKEFHIRRASPDGLAHQCRVCSRKYHKEHQPYIVDPRKCAIPDCEKVFKPKMKKRIFCCVYHYKLGKKLGITETPDEPIRDRRIEHEGYFDREYESVCI